MIFNYKDFLDLISYSQILELLKEELGIKHMKITGNNFFFLCPFHDDSIPSFCFNKDKKILKCFSCTNFNKGKACNIITFWSCYKKITFRDSALFLSDKFKIKLDIKLSSDSLTDKPIDKEKKEEEIDENFFNLIASIYYNNLHSVKGFSVLEYLKLYRNIDINTIRHFELGCSINKTQLINIFKNIKDSDIRNFYIKLGLKNNILKFNLVTKIEDFFSGKLLVIPIKNEFNKIISFSARIIDNSSNKKFFKYFFIYNFKKTNFIYNYYDVFNSEVNECYLVEGFFDVMSLWKNNIKNVVSIMGTDLTNVQLSLLKKLNKKIIVFLDGDEAGLKASIKISALLENNFIECYVVNTLSLNKDPDEIINSFNSKINIKEIIKNTIHPYIFFLKYFLKKLQLYKTEEEKKKETISDLISFLEYNNKKNSLIYKLILGIVSKLF